LNELMKSNRLPAGFDLVAAAQDPAFMRLTMELPAYAAVRVYAAERRAANAEQQAMQTLLQRLRAREGLPRAARADTAAAASRITFPCRRRSSPVSSASSRQGAARHQGEL
jgi:hypothetical protein